LQGGVECLHPSTPDQEERKMIKKAVTHGPGFVRNSATASRSSLQVLTSTARQRASVRPWRLHLGTR
jgi:hypothetical protein